MHEMSLLKDLIGKIEAIAEDNNSSKIVRVKVRLGALAHISPDHFREHFERSALGTPAQGAELEIEVMTDITNPQAQNIMLESVSIAEDITE
jgi:hydrogenase nickel incorporation protein HypA/HybF